MLLLLGQCASKLYHFHPDIVQVAEIIDMCNVWLGKTFGAHEGRKSGLKKAAAKDVCFFLLMIIITWLAGASPAPCASLS